MKISNFGFFISFCAVSFFTSSSFAEKAHWKSHPFSTEEQKIQCEKLCKANLDLMGEASCANGKPNRLTITKWANDSTGTELTICLSTDSLRKWSEQDQKVELGSPIVLDMQHRSVTRRIINNDPLPGDVFRVKFLSDGFTMRSAPDINFESPNKIQTWKCEKSVDCKKEEYCEVRKKTIPKTYPQKSFEDFLIHGRLSKEGMKADKDFWELVHGLEAMALTGNGKASQDLMKLKKARGVDASWSEGLDETLAAVKDLKKCRVVE